MKNVLRLGIIGLLGLSSVLSYVPAMAGEGRYEVVRASFNIDRSNTGHDIPEGSTIRHLNTGVTEIYARDGSLVLRARDTDAELVATPGGLRRATFVYNVPSGSHITEAGNATVVSFEGAVILRVIDARTGDITVPAFTGWIEQSNDWTVDYLDHFGGTWVVPSDPPDPGNDVVDFLFTAIENQAGNKILQPVLEWNQSGSGRWTGRAWYGSSGGYYASSPINASAGNSITGVMDNYGGASGWLISFQNTSTSQSTSITTTILGTSTLAVFTALEGYNIDGNSDVPGDTTFDNMDFEYNANNIDITWNPVDSTPPGSGLTGLDVEIFSDAKVKLHTAN